ncbi:MAG: hypothetical protein U5K69_17540 [Balneolaceae bacterium]|nr:hypothetical protein [Balneolaceae bacterium]
MFLRYIHIIWKYFWRTVLFLLVFILIIGGGLFGLLQLNTSQNYIANQMEEEFNTRFYGELNIGDLNGLMPFRFTFSNISLMAPSAVQSQAGIARRDTVISIDTLNTQIDLWSLLQNKLSITDFQVQNPSVQLLTEGGGSYSRTNALRSRSLRPEQARAAEPGTMDSADRDYRSGTLRRRWFAVCRGVSGYE